jgi:hypothetical protein
MRTSSPNSAELANVTICVSSIAARDPSERRDCSSGFRKIQFGAQLVGSVGQEDASRDEQIPEMHS